MDQMFGLADKLNPSDAQELQKFQEQEGQKALVQNVIHKLTDVCFKRCVPAGSISSGKLGSSEETCLRDCVNRFMDVQQQVLKAAQAGQR